MHKTESLYPPEGFVFDTYTDIQKGFMERITLNGIETGLEWLDKVKNNTEHSYPEVLTFTWKDNGSAEYIFELSKSADFADSYKIICSKTSVGLSNFEVGERYFWRVNSGETKSFSTKDNFIRFIKIDGVLNVRDIGGNKISQGMVYRGSDLCTCYKITEQGKDIFENQLKIKTEVELRKERYGVTKSAVSHKVAYKYLPYRPYEEVFEEEHRKGICDIMEFLSQEEIYPIYIHCLGGADRTGMIALFLRALAGESDEFIHLDYELTSLSTYAYGASEGAEEKGYRSRNSSYYRNFLDLLDAYAPGETLSKKTEAFLLDCGVKTEHIEKVKRILCK